MMQNLIAIRNAAPSLMSLTALALLIGAFTSTKWASDTFDATWLTATPGPSSLSLNKGLWRFCAKDEALSNSKDSCLNYFIESGDDNPLKYTRTYYCEGRDQVGVDSFWEKTCGIVGYSTATLAVLSMLFSFITLVMLFFQKTSNKMAQ